MKQYRERVKEGNWICERSYVEELGETRRNWDLKALGDGKHWDREIRLGKIYSAQLIT